MKDTATSPDICVRCALSFPTCCRIAPGMEASCFPLSLEESERFALHAARLGISGWVSEPNSEAFLRAMQKLFPGQSKLVHELFPSGQAHRRLPLTPEWGCVFLARDGCVLPVAVRPYYCRLYPFWFINTTLFTFTSPQCLAVNTCSSTGELCDHFKTDPSALHSLYDSLCIAWGLKADISRCSCENY